MTQKRLEKEMTQIKLAELCNVSSKTISEIERGNKNPSPKLAKKLAKVLGVRMDKFYEEENEIA